MPQSEVKVVIIDLVDCELEGFEPLLGWANSKGGSLTLVCGTKSELVVQVLNELRGGAFGFQQMIVRL